jgi:hypothetical protein
MADRNFIESLNIEDNVFELKENCTISYLVHYRAPYTGDGDFEIPAGTRFCMYGPMGSDTMYMDIVGDMDKNLLEALMEKEKAVIPELSTRISGFSFYITRKQMEELPLNFISGSRERCLEIIKLIRDKNTI